MYAYIEAEYEGDAEGAVAAYRELTEAVKVQPKGLPDKDFRELYDKVASGVPVQGDPGVIEQLNPQQRFALNEIKKYLKRK